MAAPPVPPPVPPPVIRRATGADAGGLARLRWEWRAGQGRPLELDEAGFGPRFERWVVDHLASHRPVVAVVDGTAGATVVGMAWLAVLERVPGPDRWDRRSGVVQAVYVTPAHRGGGLGAAIVQALIAEAHALGLDYLTVHPSARSFPLYRRLGFAEFGGVLELDVKADRMPAP